MNKNYDSVVSVRVPDNLLKEVDKFVDSSPVKVSRSAAIVYLVTKGLISEGLIKKD